MISDRLSMYILHSQRPLDWEDYIGKANCVFCNVPHKNERKMIWDNSIIHYCGSCDYEITMHRDITSPDKFSNNIPFDKKYYQRMQITKKLRDLHEGGEDPADLIDYDQTGLCPFCDSPHNNFHPYRCQSDDLDGLEFFMCKKCFADLAFLETEEREKQGSKGLHNKRLDFARAMEDGNILEGENDFYIPYRGWVIYCEVGVLCCCKLYRGSSKDPFFITDESHYAEETVMMGMKKIIEYQGGSSW